MKSATQNKNTQKKLRNLPVSELMRIVLLVLASTPLDPIAHLEGQLLKKLAIHGGNKETTSKQYLRGLDGFGCPTE